MRAHFSQKYTSSARKPNRFRFTSGVAAVIGVLAVSGVGMANSGSPTVNWSGQQPSSTQAAVVDTWDEVAATLFQALLDLMRRDPPPGYSTSTAVSKWAIVFDKALAESGIPVDLDEQDTAAVLADIRQLDTHLRSAPERLGAELQAATLATLQTVYAKLGGDPGDLGRN